jgi:hypothetical protein
LKKYEGEDIGLSMVDSKALVRVVRRVSLQRGHLGHLRMCQQLLASQAFVGVHLSDPAHVTLTWEVGMCELVAFDMIEPESDGQLLKDASFEVIVRH